MALKQTRRTVSFNREVYEAIMAESARRGVSASAFVESLVREVIPDLPVTWHRTLEQVKAMKRARPTFMRSTPQRTQPVLRHPNHVAVARQFVERRERQAQRALEQEVQKLRRRWGLA